MRIFGSRCPSQLFWASLEAVFLHKKQKYSFWSLLADECFLAPLKQVGIISLEVRVVEEE